jgi:hypothetical protein
MCELVEGIVTVARTVRRLPAPDEDQAECEVCGAIMDSWNSTEVPSYTLIKPRGADI